MSTVTQVTPLTAPPVAVVAPYTRVEYKVIYSCRDHEGDQVLGEDPFDGLAEAAMECEQILTYQEAAELPTDARVWWRIQPGPWRMSGGVL